MPLSESLQAQAFRELAGVRLVWNDRAAVLDLVKKVSPRVLRKVPELCYGDEKQRTENLIIEGNNLQVMASLYRYKGKVDIIYADPPYNTGNKDFRYNDRWINDPNDTSEGDFVSQEDGGRHTKWLNFMYPRLMMMRDMLKPTGLIAISIDDQELHRLGMLMDEIFLPANRLACAPWKADPGGGDKKQQLRSGHEYLLIYSRGERSKLTREEREVVPTHRDKWGKYKKGRELLKWGSHSLRVERPTMFTTLIAPDGAKVLPIRNDGKEGCWRWGEKLLQHIIKDPSRAHWEKTSFDPGVTWQRLSERWVPYEKVRDMKRAVGWSTWLDAHGTNPDGTKRLKEIFGEKIFDTAKPVELIEWLISLYEDNEALVLDPFAGSGTTAEAVLRANVKDDGERRFILIEPGLPTDRFARTLTAERIKRVISGKLHIGKQDPVLGGFSFFTVGRRVDKDAILAMEKGASSTPAMNTRTITMMRNST